MRCQCSIPGRFVTILPCMPTTRHQHPSWLAGSTKVWPKLLLVFPISDQCNDQGGCIEGASWWMGTSPWNTWKWKRPKMMCSWVMVRATWWNCLHISNTFKLPMKQHRWLNVLQHSSILHLIVLVVCHMWKSQGSQSGQFEQEKPWCNWCWSLCLCRTWMFHPSFSCGFSKGREVITLILPANVPLLMSNPDIWNIDYAICQALGYNTASLPEALIEYDVACQWSINFAKRLQESSTLQIPHGLKWIAAVGKFYLGAHQEDCFTKISLNFVQGAGQQDGEILETLWASLNKCSSSIRAMSKAYRQEALDDQICDSNWKKITIMGAVLIIISSTL